MLGVLAKRWVSLEISYFMWTWIHDEDFVKACRPWEFIRDRWKEYSRRKEEINIGWEPPSVGWFCLNTDGATKFHYDVSGYGGLFRDQGGD